MKKKKKGEREGRKKEKQTEIGKYKYIHQNEESNVLPLSLSTPNPILQP